MNHFKESRYIIENDSFDGQIEIFYPDQDRLDKINVVLTPIQGMHEGAKYTFYIYFYKDTYPIIKSKEHIYHPNMDPDEICLNIYEIWEEKKYLSLEAIITTIFWLLENPNFDDPVNKVEEDNYKYNLNLAIHGHLKGFDKCINE